MKHAFGISIPILWGDIGISRGSIQNTSAMYGDCIGRHRDSIRIPTDLIEM